VPRDGSALSPMSVLYRGAHRGDHTSWEYVAYISIAREAHAGQPAWRESYRLQGLPPGPSLIIEGTTVVDSGSLAAVVSQDVFGATRTRLSYEQGRVTGEIEDGDGTVAVDIPTTGNVIRCMWTVLDLFLMGLPPHVGHKVDFHIVDTSAVRLRPFSLTVEGQEHLRVPAGEYDVMRIALQPPDDDRTLTSTYHVRTAQPRVVVRKEYVVNPETVAERKRSVGIEELASVDFG
jgi:hypothetical protein